MLVIVLFIKIEYKYEKRLFFFIVKDLSLNIDLKYMLILLIDLNKELR